MFNKLLTIVFVFLSMALAQSSDDISKTFEQAIKDYNEAKWSSSLDNFNKIANEYKLNSKTSIALIFIGKINLVLENYSDAEKNLLRLLNEFPQSKYSDEAKITLSRAYLDNKEFTKSFWSLCSIFGSSQQSEIKAFARKKAEEIALNYLSASEVKLIHDSTKVSPLKPFLLLLNGKIHLQQQNDRLAQEAFMKVIESYPDSYEKTEAKKLLDGMLLPKKNIDKPDVVGVILPLSSSLSLAAAASEILEGIKYALSEFNEGRDKKIGILIRDSELSKSKIEEIHDEFENIEKLKCIIGPIYSSEVKDVLEVFKNINVPIISPTATDDYLADTYKNFFQANPSFIARGRLMAQYIYFVGNKRKIAILNSIDGYSPILSSSFAQEFEKLGGKIIIRESYKSSIVDLKEQIKKISELLNQIEGIYIPLSDKQDIPVLLSYLSQIELEIPVYGDQDWMTSSSLESAAFLDNKLIFCSDYFIKFDDQEYQNFSKSFYSKTKLDINRNILYGYDTMKYLLTIMRVPFSSNNALKQKMISGIIATGFHNNVCFDSYRINRYLNIIRYANRKFELVDKFKLNN
jgi:ABC-type branched-subunit amino acid transport system substrate-binding protein/predicted negative regulator of RcsB-dependent stress response